MLINSGNMQPEMQDKSMEKEKDTESSKDPMDSKDSMDSQEYVTITVEGGNFYFSPNEIRVKQGEKVKIVFKNVQGTHDFVLDEFDVKTSIISTGESEEVMFVADRSGEYEFYCSVGSHREMGMVGTIIVE